MPSIQNAHARRARIGRDARYRGGAPRRCQEGKTSSSQTSTRRKQSSHSQGRRHTSRKKQGGMWKRKTHNIIKHTLTYNTHEQHGQHNFEFLFFSSMGVPLVRGLFPRGPKQPSTPPPTPAAAPIPKPSEPPWRKKTRGFTRTSEPPTQRMSGSHDSRCYQDGVNCVCTNRNGESCPAGSLFRPIGAAVKPQRRRRAFRTVMFGTGSGDHVPIGAPIAAKPPEAAFVPKGGMFGADHFPIGATAVPTSRDLYTFGQSQSPAQLLPAETVPVTFAAPVVEVSIPIGY